MLPAITLQSQCDEMPMSDNVRAPDDSAVQGSAHSSVRNALIQKLREFPLNQALVLGGIGLWLTWLQLTINRESAQRSIEAQASASANALALERDVAEREWSLSFAQFLATHQGDIFSKDSATRERMKAVILLTYPDSLWRTFSANLIRTGTASAVRRTWSTLPPPRDSSSFRAFVVKIPAHDSMVSWDYDVYVGRADGSGCLNAPPTNVRAVAPARNRVYVVRTAFFDN